MLYHETYNTAFGFIQTSLWFYGNKEKDVGIVVRGYLNIEAEWIMLGLEWISFSNMSRVYNSNAIQKLLLIIKFLLTDVFRKLKLDVGIMSKWLGRFNGASGKGSVAMKNNNWVFFSSVYMINAINFLNTLMDFVSMGKTVDYLSELFCRQCSTKWFV